MRDSENGGIHVPVKEKKKDLRREGVVHVSWMEGWREIANGERKGKMREG